MFFQLNELRRLVTEAVRLAYQILGVEPSASEDEIRIAYKKKAIQLHPDRNPGKDTSEEMKRLNVAFGLLSNPTQRSRYDAVGDKTLGDFGSSFGGGARPSSGPRPRDPFDDFVEWSRRAREKRDEERRKQQQQPPPPPNAGDSSTPPTSRRRTFVFSGYDSTTGRRSSKVWWIETDYGPTAIRVGWGKLYGTQQTTVHRFSSWNEKVRWAGRTIRSKVAKGYKEVTNASSSSSQGTPPPQSPPPRQDAAPASGANKQGQTRKPNKDTYKIYGKSPGGKGHVHTRYGGKVYVGPRDSRFRAGDKATVALGTDGRLSVHNPNTKHTQHWSNEAFEAKVDEVLIETLLRLPL